MRSRSRHSRRTLPTQRTAWAFAFGACTGCPDHGDSFALEDVIEAAVELRVAIVDQEVQCGSRSSVAISRLRACWAVHTPVGFGVQATNSIRRLSSERKKST
jgi:hypothetical protein